MSVSSDDLHIDGAGNWTVKVGGKWLDKFNTKRGVYEVVKFKSKEAAIRAAEAKNKANLRIWL